MTLKFIPKSKKLRVLVVFVLVIALVSIIPHIWANLKLRAAVQQAKSKGVLVEIEQLILPQIPDKENACIILNNIEQKFEGNDGIFSSYHHEDSQMLDDLLGKIKYTSADISKGDLQSITQIIAKYQQIFEILEPALDRQNSRFNANYSSKQLFQLEVPNYLTRQILCKLLKADSLINIHEGKHEEAYKRIKDMLRLGRWCIEEHCFLISTLIGISMIQDTCKTLNHLENVSPPDPKEIDFLFAEMQLLNINKALERSMKMDTAGGFQSINSFISRRADWGGEMDPLYEWFLRYPGHFIVRKNQANHLDKMCELIDFIHFPSYKAKLYFGQLESKYAKGSNIISFSPNYEGICRRRDRAIAYLELSKISFSLFAYKEENGSFPEKLESIQGVFDGALPIDPFSGELYSYIPQKNGFLIYSFGSDMQDNRGSLKPIDEYNNPEPIDIVWKHQG